MHIAGAVRLRDEHAQIPVIGARGKGGISRRKPNECRVFLNADALFDERCFIAGLALYGKERFAAFGKVSP